MTKTEELTKIAQEIARCRECKKGKSGKPVPGEGNPDAEVVFVGEAPGVTESKTGRPFVGRSGQFLREQIRAIGLREDQMFITSPVKYLPKHGTPTLKDIKHGRIHLTKQLEVINPKLIVLLGNVAVRGVLDENHPIGHEHGKSFELEGHRYFFTYHPAAALRFPKIKEQFIQDFQKLKQLL